VDELLLSVTEFRAGGDIRQTEIQRAEPFVPEPIISEVEVATGKLKRYKPPGSDQIPAELIQAVRGRAVHSEVQKLIKLVWNKEGINCHTYSQKG
jgi:hypothetical protein